MNKGLLTLNIILLVAVGVLFFLYFGKKTSSGTVKKENSKDSIVDTHPFRVAYFDMDSVESNFVLAKEMQAELMKKDENISGEMNRMQNNYQQRFQKLQQQGPTMNQTQVEAAQRELFQMEQNIKSRKSQLDQDYQAFYINKQQEIISLIKKFCEEYNKDKRYAMIIANEPGLIYYKDSAFNITPALLKGLNEMYSKQKKSKK